jgi:hypothetical protein
MTFSEFYNALPILYRPQFTDQLNNGGKYRIVYSAHPGLWSLSDWVVSSVSGTITYLVQKP